MGGGMNDTSGPGGGVHAVGVLIENVSIRGPLAGGAVGATVGGAEGAVVGLVVGAVVAIGVVVGAAVVIGVGAAVVVAEPVSVEGTVDDTVDDTASEESVPAERDEVELHAPNTTRETVTASSRGRGMRATLRPARAEDRQVADTARPAPRPQW